MEEKKSYLFKRPDNQWYWFGVALLLKCVVITFLMYNLDLFDNNGVIGICNGDCPDYLLTARSLATTGTFGKSDGISILPYVGRMPGYDVLLAPLWVVFDKTPIILNITVLLQIIISAFSTYFLAKIGLVVFKKDNIFYLVFFLYAINTYVTFYDLTILTESLSIAMLIFSTYLIINSFSPKKYFLAGILFTWAFLMRPFFGVILILFALYIFYKHYFILKQSLKRVFFYSLCFLISFLVFEISWIYRNYSQFDRFIPLAEGGFRDGRQYRMMQLMSAWGFDFIEWNPTSEILVFTNSTVNLKVKNKYQVIEDLPTYIYTSTYNIDSLKNLRLLLKKTDISNTKERIENDSIICSKLKQYRSDFIREKPFYYYLIAPLRLSWKFLFNSGTYNISNQPFNNQPLYAKAVKILYTLIYYLTLLVGLCSIFFIFHLKSIEKFLIFLIPIYIIVFFTAFIRAIEYRYFATAFPFFTILTCYKNTIILEKLNKYYGFRTKI